MSFRAFAFETERFSLPVRKSATPSSRRCAACCTVAISFSFVIDTLRILPFSMSLKANSILIASNNAHKLQEFREIFRQFGAGEIELLTPEALGITLDP